MTVAQAEIIIADERLLPKAVELYNACFRPKREVDFFKRRFMGRYNSLTLLARMDDKPVGFWIGFELKPGMFYHWLGAVTPDVAAKALAVNFRRPSRPGRRTTATNTFAANA